MFARVRVVTMLKVNTLLIVPISVRIMHTIAEHCLSVYSLSSDSVTDTSGIIVTSMCSSQYLRNVIYLF